MKKIKKLVAVTGKYKGQDGKEKSQYVNCGALFQRDDGSFCINLQSLPLGEFNGWINAYDLDENRAENNANGMAQTKKALAPEDQDFNSDIPF